MADNTNKPAAPKFPGGKTKADKAMPTVRERMPAPKPNAVNRRKGGDKRK